MKIRELSAAKTKWLHGTNNCNLPAASRWSLHPRNAGAEIFFISRTLLEHT